MQIAVLLKQVPDSDEVKLDEEKGTMIREGVGTVINPLDLHAVEEAKRISKEFGGSITVISMGPPQTEDSLREAVAMGVDRVILATDRKFSGADTWATAKVLSEVLNKSGKFDLILAGEKATDGETGQVGPEVAAMLDIPFSTYISKIVIRDDGIEVLRTLEESYEKQLLPFGSLLTVLANINEPTMPTLSGKIKARSFPLEIIDSQMLGIDSGELGLQGSPTRVSKITFPKILRKGEVFSGSFINEGMEKIISKLKESAII